jgi:hypothetical protein
MHGIAPPRIALRPAIDKQKQLEGEFSMRSLCAISAGLAAVLPASLVLTVAGSTSAAALAPDASPTASLALATSNAQPKAGQSVTLTVTLTVTGSSAPDLGAYSIYDGTKALVSGAAANTSTGYVYSTSSLSAGSHVLTAKYVGTVNGLSATSNAIDVDVAASSPALTVLDTALPPAYVGTQYDGVQLEAAGGKSPYKWTLVTGSDLPSGMSLTSEGNITGAPKTATAAFSFKVDVKDSSSPAKTGSATIHLPLYGAVAKCNTADSSAATLGWLKGSYAMHLDLIDMTGSGDASWIVGEFSADGKGGFTAIADLNGPSYNNENSAQFSGTYKVGSDGRGQFNMETPGGLLNFCIALDAMKNGVAGGGQMIEADSTDEVAHGVFYAQDASHFTEASVKGSWAFGTQGAKINQDGVALRQASAGYLTLNGAGKVTGGELDLSSDKTSSSSLENQYLAQAAITGTYTLAANGRGTLALKLSQGGSSQAVNFVFYMAGPNQILLLESDPPDKDGDDLGSMVGRAYLRTTSDFSKASLSGNSVFISNGLSTSGSIHGPKLEAGILKWDSSNGTVNGSADVNENGKVTTAAENTFTAHYSVDAHGRVTTGEVSGGGNAPVFYLVGPNWGFGVQADTAVDASELFPQTAPAGGFTAGSFSGGYSLGSLWYSFIQQTAESGEIVADSSAATAAADIDMNMAGDIALNQASTVKFEPAADGRFLLEEHSKPNTALYFVNKNLAFGIDISGQSWSNLMELDFFEQNP